MTATFIPSRVRDLLDPYNDLPTFNVKAYGAVGDGVTDDRAAIQSAIDAASTAGGGVVYLPSGTYVVGSSGNTLGGRASGALVAYAVLLKSGVTLMGDSSETTTILSKAAADCDVVRTDLNANSNIGVKGITIDGNDTTQPSSAAFNLWLRNVTDLFLEDVRSLRSGNWGCRIELCTRVRIDGYEANHVGADLNADGLHFLDTSQVSGGNIWIYTGGDDSFIIEARTQDVSDYALAGIYIQPQYSGGSPGQRGVLLLGDGTVMTGAWTISNVNLAAVTVKNAHGRAVSLEGSSYRNVRIETVSDACLSDLYISPGVAAHNGTVQNCSFDVAGSNCTGGSVIVVTTNGTLRNNRINALLWNPADGVIAAALKGDRWTGEIVVDYDPNATKTSKQQGIVVYGTYSDLKVACRDANYNLQVQNGATNNTFRLGRLTGASTADILIQGGATSNYFIGGEVTTVTNSGGATNRFFGTLGAQSKTVDAQTGTTYTLVLSDADNIVTLNNASAITLTIPTNALVAFPIGAEVVCTGIGAGLVTVAAAGGVTINNPTNASLTMARYMVFRLVKIGTDTWEVNKGSRPPDGTTLVVNASGQLAVATLAQSGVQVSHTGDTAEVVLATVSIPADALGANGSLRVFYLLGRNGSGAGSVTVRTRFGAAGAGAGGTQLIGGTLTTSLLSAAAGFGLQNANSKSSQVAAPQAVDGFGTAAAAVVTSAINTANASEFVITAQLANSGDTVTLYGITATLYPAA